MIDIHLDHPCKASKSSAAQERVSELSGTSEFRSRGLPWNTDDHGATNMSAYSCVLNGVRSVGKKERTRLNVAGINRTIFNQKRQGDGDEKQCTDTAGGGRNNKDVAVGRGSDSGEGQWEGLTLYLHQGRVHYAWSLR